jgi:hypothetical protein
MKFAIKIIFTQKKLAIVYVNFVSLILANFCKIINFKFTINFIKKLAFDWLIKLIPHKKSYIYTLKNNTYLLLISCILELKI